MTSRASLFATVAMVIVLAVAAGAARADPGEPAAPDPRITPGQVIDGWTGKPIPCRCRYQGQKYQLGTVLCMKTHLGTRLTRCELVLNNTSWVPTEEACAISGRMIDGTTASASTSSVR